MLLVEDNVIRIWCIEMVGGVWVVFLFPLFRPDNHTFDEVVVVVLRAVTTGMTSRKYVSTDVSPQSSSHSSLVVNQFNCVRKIPYQ